MPKNYFDIKMEGAPELDKILAGLPKAVEKNQLKATLRRNAKPMLRAAKLNAKKFSSELAAAVKIRTMTGTKFPAISIGPDQERWWGYAAEFGTGIYGPKKKIIEPSAHDSPVMSDQGGGSLAHPIRSSKGFRAVPWLRPAWDAHKRLAAINFKQDLLDQLLRFAARLKKQAYSGKLSKQAMKALKL